MAADPDEEFVGIDGVVAVAPLGTAAPTDATTVLPVAWKDLGLTTSDGVTRSEQVSASNRYAWQNNTRLRRIATESAIRFEFTLVQTNADVVEFFFGVAPTAEGRITANPGVERPVKAFVLDVIDRDAAGVESVVREYVPRAQVVEVGDRVAVSGDTYGWPVTVETQYSDDIDGHSQIFFSELDTTP